MKAFKTLDEQIKYLSDKKGIIFENDRMAKDTLLDNNYYNVISASKIKYVKDIVSKHHIYENHNFSDWKAYYDIDCKVSRELMPIMLDFEKTINSRTAYYIAKLIEHDEIEPKFENELVQLIKCASIKNLPDYNKMETWTYMTRMTFGETKQFIFWLAKNKKKSPLFDSYLSGILKSFMTSKNTKTIQNNLNELNNLRNHLFHFTPLNIYVTSGRGKNGILTTSKRKKAINFIYNLKDGTIKSDIMAIYENADRFVTIKNNQHKVS